MNRRGFTLIELIIVMLILSILTSVAAPRFAAATARRRVEASARRVAADLSYCQRQAKSTGKSQTVQFTVATNQYQLMGLKPPNRTSGVYIVQLSKTGYPSNLVTADFSGDTKVVYDMFGRPNASGSVVLRCGTFQKTVTLDAATGKARVL